MTGPERVTEGAVTVAVPEQPEAGIGDGVFFNPDMELNRDVTVAALAAFRSAAADHANGAADGASGEDEAADWGDERTRPRRRPETYLDATAATGIRGVRAAAAGWTATLADVDEDAVALCERNLAENGLSGEVRQRDANALLWSRGAGGPAADVVDLDPFGTPMPFADAALANAGQLLCVTATDTAPLCGAHFESGLRSYGAVPVTTEYHAEVGLRVLLSALARAGARHDVGVTPLLSHVSDHYVRTYLAVDRRATAANRSLEALGHVHHCRECLGRDAVHGQLARPPERCPHCGADAVATMGPLWLDVAHDPGFVAATRREITDEMGTARRARRLLERIEGECPEPTHYDQHELTEQWNEPATGMGEFLEALREAGHEASRSHFGGTTFKTTASVTEIRDAAPDPP